MVNSLSCLIALFLLAGTALVRAENLGRLFFTPEERVAMEKARQGNTVPAATIAEDTPAPLDSVTLNGHIRRSSGKSTVWLNGVPQPLGAAAKQIGVTENGSAEVIVKLPDSSRTYPLKVGQTLTPGNGEIRESYRPAQPLAAAPDAPPGVKPSDPNATRK